MRLVLNPADGAVHGDWLRSVPGAYEWWYFDAVSEDRTWTLACIWFLGNPFSPYYRLAAQKRPADPFAYNALFFALYREGQLHTYHFTRFPKDQICADEQRPASLRFGPSTLSQSESGDYYLRLRDENANRRRLVADIAFVSPVQISSPDAVTEVINGSVEDVSPHFWQPAAPSCLVQGELSLRDAQNSDAERIVFQGHGYHDHNWGTLPFDRDIQDWYWARAQIGPRQTVIMYHVLSHTAPPISHLLFFEDGQLTHYDDQAKVQRSRYRLNGFGTAYATCLDVIGDGLQARFLLGQRLDSAPFYLRTLCTVEVKCADWPGTAKKGDGLGEYFRPRLMSSALVASAMKARVVEV